MMRSFKTLVKMKNSIRQTDRDSRDRCRYILKIDREELGDEREIARISMEGLRRKVILRIEYLIEFRTSI